MPKFLSDIVAQTHEMDLLTYLKNYESQESVHFFWGSTCCIRIHENSGPLLLSGQEL